VIDGVIGEHEWDAPAAVTAMAPTWARWCRRSSRWCSPGGMTSRTSICACIPPAKDMVLQAACKEPDNEGSMIFEDHVEIQISNHGRENVFRPGVGFLQICANPSGQPLRPLVLLPQPRGARRPWTSGTKVEVRRA